MTEYRDRDQDGAEIGDDGFTRAILHVDMDAFYASVEVLGPGDVQAEHLAGAPPRLQPQVERDDRPGRYRG